MEFLNIHQIYYKPEQELHPKFIPYNNIDKCTVYFENTVIKELIESGAHKDCEYFGVVSARFSGKVHNFNYDDFCNILKEKNSDIMAFVRMKPPTDKSFLEFTSRFHPYFKVYFQRIFEKAGFAIPEYIQEAVYFNYFVAKSDIYEQYVKEMLIPCMEVMKDMPELFMNSNYKKGLPFTEETKKSTGVDYYPYHPFICERFFSYYVQLKGLKVDYPYPVVGNTLQPLGFMPKPPTS